MSSNQQHRRIGAFLGLAVILIVFSWASAQAASVFINEIHYDNSGGDVGESIEIGGPAGKDLTGWSILLYNGSNGTIYGTDVLRETIMDQQNGFGTVAVHYPANGLQNGSPDGLALVDTSDTVIQFLSYEGSFAATNGPAAGMTSTDIRLTEPGTTPIGHSLQLIGTGTMYEDFTWTAAMPSTFGSVNTGQTFLASVRQPVPEPSTLFLFASGLTGLSFWRWKQRQQRN